MKRLLKELTGSPLAKMWVKQISKSPISEMKTSFLYRNSPPIYGYSDLISNFYFCLLKESQFSSFVEFVMVFGNEFILSQFQLSRKGKQDFVSVLIARIFLSVSISLNFLVNEFRTRLGIFG